MAAHLPAHILNDATSQDDRRAGAPAPDDVAVDDRSVAQLLAFAADYGALIRFYDLENMPNGDWSAFFAADPAIAEALHASLDLVEIEKTLQRLLRDARDAVDHPGRLKPLERLLRTVMRLLAILDRAQIDWHSIEAAIQRYFSGRRSDAVKRAVGRLQAHLGNRTLGEGLQGDFEDGRGGAWHATLIEILEDLVAALLDELQSGILEARAAMERSLSAPGHSPQNAIYNAFVRMFVEAREELNRFPRRLVDFYYDEVLRQHELAATPDRTFLTFTRAKDAVQASVPRGTLFPAGADSEGQPINYAATGPLEVTPATVAELSVHRVTHAKIGGRSIETGVLSGIVKLDPTNPTAATPFPMFGGEAGKPAGALTMQRAALGFCVASPLLMLTGGTRTVTIGLVVSYKQSSEPADPSGSGDELPELEALAKALEETLTLHYSTAGGWMAVDQFTVVPAVLDEGTTLYSISFTLPSDAPALVSISDKPLPNAAKPSLPADAFPDRPKQPAVVAQLNLDDKAHQLPAFALLATIQFDHLYLDVSVEGLDRLTLVTPNGPADTSHSFAVFGLPPAQFSALAIQSPELFVKPLKSLSVAIDWAGLPVTSTGFKGYYQNYTLNADGMRSHEPLFDNSSFRVAFSVDNPGYWDVAKGPQPYLFQTGADITACPPPPDADISDSGAIAGALPAAAAPVSRLSCLTVPGVQSRAVPPYYNPGASALRLTLAAPSYAFGNILYSSNLMAASMAMTKAAIEQARQGGERDDDPSAKVAAVAQQNATASDRDYAKSVGGAVGDAVSALGGEAVAAVQRGVAQAKAPAETKAWWLTDLEDAVSAVVGSKGSLWSRLLGRGGIAADVAGVVNGVKDWIARHEQALGAEAAGEVGKAKGLLDAAGNLAAAHSATAEQPPAMRRPTIAAAAQQAQIVVLPSPLPNPPWLPMATALSVSYTASIDTAIVLLGARPAPLASKSGATIIPVSGAGEGDPLAVDFWHIGPFGVLATPAPDPGGSVGVMPPIQGSAALYIQLSTPVSPVSLLFVLSAGQNGWWDDPPAMIWEERVEGKWQNCKILDDTTQGLKSSGIVTVAPTVLANTVKAPRLRVRAHGRARAEDAPIVQCVVANALTVTWQGPGGAAQLGTPMAKGTIGKSQDKLPGIASIVQPMESFGGSPPAVGADFQMWMAERLRHKGFGIDPWDYARLVLAAVPSLWQAAVVPAVDERTGARAPGKVWIVAVAGPNTPNIADATIPQVDLTTLSEIGETLNGCISSFADVVATNPPYLRLTVTAQVEFSGANTPAFWEEQLGAELLAWLSPWPPPASHGTRPRDYYTRRAIADFIRSRGYVRGIIHLEVTPEARAARHGHYYLTSALQHNITGVAADPIDPPRVATLHAAAGEP